MNSLNKFIVFAVLGMMIAGTLSLSSTAFAEPKNGWGKATSERATEQEGIGDHSSDPDGDGTRGNDNQDDDDNNHRSGIGNVAETFTGQKNPDELGDFLDCADEDVDEGEGGSVRACS
jgi:hypothetical protein